MLHTTDPAITNGRKRKLSFSNIKEETTLDKEMLSPLSSPDIFPDSPQSVLSYEDPDSDGEDEPVSKVPRYIGTIYEARLAPLSPVTTIPVPSYVGSAAVRPRQQDQQLQQRMLTLILRGDQLVLDQFLEENGKFVDVNQYGEDGVTPVQRICQSGGSVDLAKVLVKYGADLRLTSRDGWSPLHMAVFSGNYKLLSFIRNCPKWSCEGAPCTLTAGPGTL